MYQINIQPICAEFENQSQTQIKQDIYILFSFGRSSIKTEQAKGTSQSPTWNESHNMCGNGVVSIKVFGKDHQGQVCLGEGQIGPMDYLGWIELWLNDQPTGHIKFKLQARLLGDEEVKADPTEQKHSDNIIQKAEANFGSDQQFGGQPGTPHQQYEHPQQVPANQFNQFPPGYYQNTPYQNMTGQYSPYPSAQYQYPPQYTHAQYPPNQYPPQVYTQFASPAQYPPNQHGHPLYPNQPAHGQYHHGQIPPGNYPPSQHPHPGQITAAQQSPASTQGPTDDPTPAQKVQKKVKKKLSGQEYPPSQPPQGKIPSEQYSRPISNSEDFSNQQQGKSK